MATTTPFAFNTGGTIPGESQVGDLAVGTAGKRYDNRPGGVTWYMDCDQELGYSFALPNPSLQQPLFYLSDGLTDQAFLDMTNYLSRLEAGPVFTEVNEAYNWISTQEYWTSYPPPPSPTPTPSAPLVSASPTPTISVTPSITPSISVSVTPSVTPSITVTPSVTPSITSTPSITPSISITPTPTPSFAGWLGTGFTTEWVTSVTGETITLPLEYHGPSSQFDATVDWGDGSPTSTITSYNDPDRSHVYDDAGTYQIEIKGECSGWKFLGAGGASKITKIIHWGEATGFGGFASLDGGFYGCSNLTNIAEGSIIAKSGLTDLSDMFNSCYNLTTVPAGMFDNCTNVTTFESAFEWCTSLTTIPAGLFSGNTSVTSFASTFYFADLTSIPTGLFDNNTSVTSFASTFRRCENFTTIPTGLFDNNTSVTSFASTFYDCSSITAIPTGLFDNNINVTSFSGTFYNCNPITTIPTGLFDYNTGVTSFSVVFRYCSNITSIPSGLFDNNTLVTSFAWTFGECGIVSVPSGLFDNNPLVTSFRETFRSMSSLTTVPTDIFQYNTGVTSFRSTFTNCGNLAITPKGMFTGHTLATDFYGLFYRGYAVELDPNMFDESGVSGSTRFFNQNVNFDYAFSIVDSNNYDGASAGTAPELWDYNYGSGSPSTTDAMRGRDDVSVLTNYDDIPVGWL